MGDDVGYDASVAA